MAAAQAFDILGDPVRRRILELLAVGEQSAGSLTDVIRREFGITQAAVSQHLRALRESGFVFVRIDGSRRIYSVDPRPLQQADAWIAQFRGFWEHHLNSLTREIARGKTERRDKAGSGASSAEKATRTRSKS
ncbi:MAG TPA: metalloregulator ArsR/SmtB family transcription factor [Bryobacteraceae bacterium]|nr:metalloregulator ArsR/SmtB family transcription factor [Bryobacteraceae bacterium]